MDDTTQSRTSDAAAATRKRRSSILKSQRPPRTPFCELEFNVCTPPDMTKSRRVSFSRRTGVAEFATNEATTTWKNFYEEHNKSLESSGNDSEVNSKEPIAHLGKRIFDQQFEEVEAVDFIGHLHNGLNISTSVTNINFTQMESTEKLTAPQNNFELSAFTEQQSKLFSDDLAVTCHGNVTDGIDVNFSTIQPIGEKDDLDEIQKDLQQRNVASHSSLGRQNLSEYIEVDLNTTRVAMTNDESDMSITDTVYSPKVQDVSKSYSIEKKVSVTKDWVADKENIMVNPYVAPRESVNFAINDEVLIFDGKKLIIRTESPTPTNENYRQTLLPNPSEVDPQRKTIILNCNDDLPNYKEDAQAARNASNSAGVCEQKQSLIMDQPRLGAKASNYRTIIYDENSGDISVTQAVPNLIPNTEKHRTILYDPGNISITQAIPSTIIDKEKRRTIVYDNDNDISTTQAVPANLLLFNENNQKRKTIVFDNEGCDISMTQALPANIIAPETASRTVVIEDGTANVSIIKPTTSIVESIIKNKRRTVAYENNTGNISVTHSVTSNTNLQNVLPDRRRTIVFESDVGNISVTQALPTNIIMPQNLNVTTYGNDPNLSMTRAIPTNIILEDNKGVNRRRTVVFEDDTGNLSITQTVSTNQVIQGLTYQQQSKELNDIVIATNEVLHINKVNTNNTRTIVIESDNQNVSMMQAVNKNQILSGIAKQGEASSDSSQKLKRNQRRTIVFEDNDADISMTQVVNVNELIFGQNKEKQNVSHNELEVATNTALHYDNNLRRTRTITYDDDVQDKSLMSVISKMSSIPSDEQEKELATRDMSLLENTNIFTKSDELCSKEHNIDKEQIKLSNMKRTKKIIEYEKDNNVSINPGGLEKFGSKVTDSDRISSKTHYDSPMLAKPIPAGLSAVQYNDIKPSQSKDRQSMLESLTNMAVDDVFVYQAQPVVKQKEKIENIDPQKAFDVDDGKASFVALTNMLRKSSRSFGKITPVFETLDVNVNHSDDLTSDLQSNKTSEILSEKNDNEDMPKVIDVTSKKIITYEENIDTSQALPEYFNSKVTQEKTPKIEESALLSKPIPSKLSTVQLDSIKNSDISIKKRESVLTDLTNITVDDIMVYHKTDTIKQQPEQTDKIDFSKHNAFAIEYDRATSPIIIDSIAKLSNDIETQQEDLNVEEDQTCQVPEETESKDSVSRAIKPRIAILNKLLDMSETSLGGEEDKSIMAKISSEHVSRLNSKQIDTESSKEDMFFITNENNEDAQIDIPDEIKESWEIVNSYPPRIESEENENVDGNLRSKLSELKNVLKEHNVVRQSSLPETVLNSKPGSMESFDVPKKLKTKGFKMANDTNELLEMISDFTNKPMSNNLEPHSEEQEDESDTKLEGDISLNEHDKRKESEPKRLSIAPKRHSTVLSREDLLSNLSMAGEALRKSRFELDKSMNADDIGTETPQHDDSHKKHVSSGVVKALHFEDDDSLCQKSGSNQLSALKKTAFGEASYMKESKFKVIPDYLEDTDIKALMNDLVKPMADVLPYTTTTLGRGLKKNPSTCSTQIQANLLNTSQVDLVSELYSNPESMYDMHKFSSTDSAADPSDRTVSQEVTSTTSLSQSEKMVESAYNRAHESRRRGSHATHVPQGGYIIFDHNNPLNNILINPPLDVDIHSYDPIRSDGATDSSSKVPDSVEDSSSSAVTQFVSNQYRLESKLTIPLPDIRLTKKVDEKPALNKLAKSEVQEQKDTQVNTVIVMKGNKELLAQSSSLTLVDDALIHSRFDLKIEDTEEVQEIHKPKKRTHSPKSRRDRHKHSPLAEVSPKPAFKMQRRSFNVIKRGTIISPTDIIQSTNLTMPPSSPKTQMHHNNPTTTPWWSPSPDTEMRSNSPTITMQSISSSKLARSVSSDIKMQSDNHRTDVCLDTLKMQMQSDNPESQVRSVSPMIQTQTDYPEKQIRSASPETQVRSVSPVVMRSVSPIMIVPSDSPIKLMRSTSPEMTVRSVSPIKLLRPTSPEMTVRSVSPIKLMRSVSPEMSVRSVSPMKPMRSVSPEMAVRSVSPMIQMRTASPEKTMRSVSPMIPMLLICPETQTRSTNPETALQSVSPMAHMRLHSPDLHIRIDNPGVQMTVMQKEALIPEKQIEADDLDTHNMHAVSSDKHTHAFHPATRMHGSPNKLQRASNPTTQMQPSPEKPMRPLSPDNLMQGISSDKHARIHSPDKLMRALRSDARVRARSPDRRMRVLSPERRMRAVSPTVKMQSFSPPTSMRPSSATTERMDMNTYNYEKPFRLVPEQTKNTGLEKSESPKRQNSPKKQNSPKSHNSPKRQNSPKRKSPSRKSPTRMKSRKPGTNVTIQHVTTTVNPEAASKENWQRVKEDKEEEMQDRTDARIDTLCSDDLDISSPDLSSLASSKNLTESIHNQLKMDWGLKSCSEISSKSSFESDMDVILKIDSMPFMGSSDCEWESSNAEAWSFLLLHARLRFTVKFAAVHRVRPDTPVVNLALEALHQEKKNPIALLCVTYAAEMMRYYMSRGCGTARDLPRLMRQLGGTARVAARWARAMHDARARLAFSLTPDGFLALKVANASLRTVWEVTMQLELVVADARSAPWPRAGRVRAARVLAGRAPPPATLKRLIKHAPNDWGHVPNTIWKIFRYLKHKKRDDDEIASFV